MPGTVAGRIVCPHCGANNFETQAACWKCGASLHAGSAPAASPALARPSSGSSAAADLPLRPLSHVQPPPDPAIAIGAAIALAVFFPYVAVPLGIVFLMLDDRRKAEIGRVTLIAGLLLSILHSLFFAWLTKEAWDQARGFMGGPSATSIIDRAQQERQPKLTDPLPQGFPTP